MTSSSSNNRFQSLATRLSLWIVTLGAIIFITVLSTNYFLSRTLLEDYVENLAKETSASTVKKIETIFNSVSTNAATLAAITTTSGISEKQIHQLIPAVLKTDDKIYGMTVALEPHTLLPGLGDFSPYYYRKGDTIAYSDLASSEYQYRTWPWYSVPKASTTPTWSEPYLDEGGGNVMMTTYSTPMYVQNKPLPGSQTFAGIATADIRLRWLEDVVKEISIGDTGFGFIISKNDTVIAHPDKTLNMKKLSQTDVKPENWEKYQDSKSRSSSVYLYTPCRYGSGFCWLAIETMANIGWKVVIVLPEQELISEIRSLTIKIAAIAVSGLFILFFIISIITRHLTNPLGKLAEATKDIGAGKLDTILPEVIHKDEIGMLTDDFDMMRSALKKHIAEIQEATAKQQKLESEIQIAKDIQMSMVPGSGNAIITQDRFQLFALLKPARSVGGDLYYYQQSEDSLHFIIGDVSDKGIPAALFMAKTVTLYTRALKDKLSPGQTFTMMNDLLSDNNDACMFVTALCGSINLKTGYTVMANAGHMNPIFQADKNTREFEIQGATALGLMAGVDYPDIEFQLDNKTSLIMYTDGISEAHDTDNAQYTDEKLLDFISSIDTSKSENTGNKIIKSVEDFAAGTEQFDDITLLIIRYE